MTVIIEDTVSHQVAMLNLFISNIYNIATKEAYSCLSFPLGASMQIPIKFQNEYAHQFGNNIEGIPIGFELSHPRVVTGELDYYN